VLQRRHRCRELLQAREGQHAHFGLLEGYGLAAVMLRSDAVHPDDVAQHVVAGDLLVAFLG
jgi:hypothetical protein